MNSCGAKTKGTGEPCRRVPCPNGRCKLHGGWSIGPKTEEGRRCCAQACWKHGLRSKAAREELRQIREFVALWDSSFCETIFEME